MSSRSGVWGVFGVREKRKVGGGGGGGGGGFYNCRVQIDPKVVKNIEHVITASKCCSFTNHAGSSSINFVRKGIDCFHGF